MDNNTRKPGFYARFRFRLDHGHVESVVQLQLNLGLTTVPEATVTDKIILKVNYGMITINKVSRSNLSRGKGVGGPLLAYQEGSASKIPGALQEASIHAVVTATVTLYTELNTTSKISGLEPGSKPANVTHLPGQVFIISPTGVIGLVVVPAGHKP